MRLPDLLATRSGRLTAFFLLYVTEGIPLGFTAIAVATEMRCHGGGSPGRPSRRSRPKLREVDAILAALLRC